MLTSLPPRPLHVIRDAAAAVRDAAAFVVSLAELGLAMLCPCDDDHGLAAKLLADDAA